MNAKVLKIAGIVLTAVSFVVTMASDWVNEKKLDDKVAEKVAKALESK